MSEDAKQRQEVWEAVIKQFDRAFSCTDSRVARIRDYRADQFYKWCCEQAAKEGA